MVLLQPFSVILNFTCSLRVPLISKHESFWQEVGRVIDTQATIRAHGPLVNCRECIFIILLRCPIRNGCGSLCALTLTHFIQGCFVVNGTRVLERNISRLCRCNSDILLLSLLWKGRIPLVEQSWIPFTQAYLVEIESLVFR